RRIRPKGLGGDTGRSRRPAGIHPRDARVCALDGCGRPAHPGEVALRSPPRTLTKGKTMNRYAATAASAALVACAALGVTYGAIASTRPAPAPAPDTSAIVAAEARADAAEQALSDALAAQGDADATARYTACMYALNTLNPRSDM